MEKTADFGLFLSVSFLIRCSVVVQDVFAHYSFSIRIVTLPHSGQAQRIFEIVDAVFERPTVSLRADQNFVSGGRGGQLVAREV